MPSSPPAQTIEAGQRGDAQAREEIARWFLDNERFFLHAERMLRNPEDVLDVIQESAEKIFKKISTYDQSKADFPGWCHAIVSNTAFDVLRKRKRRRETPIEGNQSSEEHADPSSGSEDLLTWETVQHTSRFICPEAEYTELWKVIQDATQSVCTEREYKVLLLYLKEYTNAEIAEEVFGDSTQTKRVEIHKYRAKGKVATYLLRHHRELMELHGLVVDDSDDDSEQPAKGEQNVR